MDLAGKRIVITRPRSQADELAASLRALGAEPVLFPVITIGALEDTTALDGALRRLADYDWVIFTSVNGVQAVWERLEALDLPGIPAGVRLAAIGPQTAAALQARQAAPDYVPEAFVAEAISPGLGDLSGRRVLLPRADIARPALALAIRQAGGIADEVAAYRTLPVSPGEAALQALRAGVDVVTFTSSSTVLNFLGTAALLAEHGLDVRRLPGNPIYACIGPVTAATAEQQGLSVAVVAETYTTAGLLEALARYTV
ncbi:MAG: uroporphyrinogen-III synthase [Chloroflexota bacterium]